MKIDKEKLSLAMARSCMDVTTLTDKTQMPRSTVNGVLSGKAVKPWTMGKIAKALNVDVTEIIETEN